MSCAHVDFDSRTASVFCGQDCDRAALISALELRGYGGAIK